MFDSFQFPVGEAAAVTAAMLWAFTSLIFTEAGRLSTPLAAIPAPFFTFFKWVLVGFSFLLLLVGVAAVAWGWIKGKPARAKA